LIKKRGLDGVNLLFCKAADRYEPLATAAWTILTATWSRERSERIESFLVWLGRRYLNAVVIENNDLDDAELTLRIQAAFDRFESG